MDKHDFMEWVREIGPTYIPNDQVLTRLSQTELVGIVGPTGVGKTSIMNKLDIPIVRCEVTRPKRDGEAKKSETYNFHEDFDVLKKDLEEGNFVQFVVSRSNEFYGTKADAYAQKGRCSIAIVANSVPSFKKFGFKKFTQFYVLPPGYVEWMRRVRELHSGDVHARMAEAIESLRAALQGAEEYNLILNDDLDTAVSDVQKILAGEEVNEHRSKLAKEYPHAVETARRQGR